MEARPERVIFAVCLFIQGLHAYLAMEVGGKLFGSNSEHAFEMAVLQLIPGVLMDLFHRKVLAPSGKLRKLFDTTCRWVMLYFFLLIVTEVAFVVFGSPFAPDMTEFIARMTMVINSFVAVFLLINLNWRKPTPPRPGRGKRQPRRPSDPLKPRLTRPSRPAGVLR
ncbi:hypothetical protein F5984_26205 [Rudanella paleaurantiibacter]|uniref:Uncharacterized protein n=1 Tax=Rudanella paleaurantiibacter TaxID=2614655 RepID=A0A7J5TRN4_9BACT|nr:hypothetical protein [Rudanella paleaurantiibacter]KAB7725376.1 hypothetical protein F5984_26205 [Rudanella paleaurantiibacter]